MSDMNGNPPKGGKDDKFVDDLDEAIPDHLTDEALDGSQIKKLAEERVAELTAEIEEHKERALRLAADLENTRRRAEKERLDAAKYGIQKFAQDLLSVADNFNRALELVPDEGGAPDAAQFESFVNGIRMTERELLSVFERNGIVRIEPKGERFDPNQHQAIAQVPGHGEPKDYVVDVAAPGFLIGDRVVRPAMVTVSTGANAAPENGANDHTIDQSF
ncbi:MAG: nucleotide exchange factor GrpE [Parvularcula sp.]